MTSQQYAAFKRAAYAAKKLETGQLETLNPKDVELIKSLLKDKDGYRSAALAEKRTESQAQQDIDRCERVVRKIGPRLCKHGKPIPEPQPVCENCEKETQAILEGLLS